MCSRYFTLAAKQGHTRGMYELALLHLAGQGTVRSCDIGVQLLKQVPHTSISLCSPTTV